MSRKKTPEGAVKEMVKEFLGDHDLVPSTKAALATVNHVGWYHMPVTNGMGVAGISDFYGHYKGFYFTIETKVPGKDPTALQRVQINATLKTGAKAFVVRCAEDLEAVREWFGEVDI